MRFTIRDLLWLTVVVALVVSGMLLIRRNHQLVQVNTELIFRVQRLETALTDAGVALPDEKRLMVPTSAAPAPNLPKD